MKKLLLFLLLFSPLCGQAQIQGVPALQTGMTASTATTGTGLAAPTANFHQITWSLIGTTPTACTITVDTSPDNSTWTTGGAIAAQTCTSSGQSPLANVVANYIRINLSTFTSTGQIRINYFGYPGGTGNIVINSGTNTGGAAMTLDMSAATSATAFKVPQIAAPAPGTTPAIDWGTNQDSYFVGDSVLGTATLDRTFWVENCTADSNCATQGASTPGTTPGTNGNINTASTNSTTKIYFTGFSIPSGTIINNKVIESCAIFKITTTATIPTLVVSLNLGSTAVFANTAVAPGSFTTNGFKVCGEIVGTGAAGSSVPVSAGVDHLSFANNTTAENTVNIPVSVATNGALIGSWGATWGGSGAGNTITLESQSWRIRN